MYKIIIPKAVVKELEGIDKTNQLLIYNIIKDLESGKFSKDKPLKGRYKSKYRKRAGNYRIIYLREKKYSSYNYYSNRA